MGDADKVFVERLDHPVLHPHPTLGVKEGEVVVVACRQDHSLRLNLNQVLPAVGIQKIWEPRTHHWVSAWDHLHILGLLSPEVHCLKSSRRSSVTCCTFGGIFERKGGLLWARYTWYTEISYPIPLQSWKSLTKCTFYSQDPLLTCIICCLKTRPSPWKPSQPPQQQCQCRWLRHQGSRLWGPQIALASCFKRLFLQMNEANPEFRHDATCSYGCVSILLRIHLILGFEGPQGQSSVHCRPRQIYVF